MPRVAIVSLGLLSAFACGGHHAAPAPAPPPARAAAPPAATASGGSAATRSAPLTDLLAEDMAPDSAMRWSGARRLRWSDFRGPPPPGGPEAARTAYGLYYGWKCRGQTFEFQVAAAFLPRQSWVKAQTLADTAESRRTLRHEQTHFDASEVGARRMRQYFANVAGACGMSDDQLRTLAQRLVTDEQGTQRRYDAETEHGLDIAKQAEWNREIARQLAALSRFAQ